MTPQKKTPKCNLPPIFLYEVIGGHKQASNLQSLAAQNQTPTLHHENNKTSKFTLTSKTKITAFKQNYSAN
jgi:hypothetical protein